MSENTQQTPEQEPNQVDTEQETDKKCPRCGGIMDYSPTTGGLHCPYCDYDQEIDSQEEREATEEVDFSSAEAKENCNWGVEKKVVICSACGGESIYDALQIAGECPYCGSNQVMEAKAENTLAPGGVCPFKIDKNQAVSNFHRWIKNKIFCPKEAKQKSKPSAFSGLYLPYWTFDADTQTTYSGNYGIDHTHRDKDGRTYTTTNWYSTSGNYNKFIDDKLVIATSRHDSSMMHKIEPFDTADNVKYKPEYIAGFASERYSIGLNDAWKSAQDAIKAQLNFEIAETIRYTHSAQHANVTGMNIKYHNIKYKYLLLPIWISSFQYKGKTYQFLVNGQTGKVGGKTPVSPLRVFIAVLAVILAIILLTMMMY